MDRFIIEGGQRLGGEIRPAGNKNAALPMLAGALLSAEPVTLYNLPEFDDVRIMLNLIESLGRRVEGGHHAASEPHVQDLCHFLNTLGAQITGIGSNTLTIHGVPQLGGGSYRIMSDHMEVGSFIGLAAMTGSELLIRDAVPEHIRMTNLIFG